jgi:hypothetical protein
MSRRRKRNPSGTDTLLLVGLAVTAGGLGYWLWTKSQAPALTPSQVSGNLASAQQTAALAAMTPAQRAAAT